MPRISRIPLSSIKNIDVKVYENPETRTASQAFQDLGKPDYMINGTLYDTKTGKTLTRTKDGGKNFGYMFSKEGFGFKEDGSVIWTTYDDAKVKNFVGGSPTLVKNGKVYINSENYSDYVMNPVNKHIRSVMALDDSAVYFIVYNEGINIDNLAAWCVRQGYKYAINLDGGGSSSLTTNNNGKMNSLYSSSRAVDNFIYIDTFNTKTVTAKETIIYCGDTKLDGLIIDGSTQAPVRAVAEMLGKKVDFIDGKVYIR